MKPKIKRAQLVHSVARTLRPEDANDLPKIRTALNDTADYLRKDGYTVPDFAQAAMVRDVRLIMERAILT